MLQSSNTAYLIRQPTRNPFLPVPFRPRDRHSRTPV